MQANIAKTNEKMLAVRDLMEKCKSQIAAALPRHMTPERMARMAYTAMQMQPALLECSQQSLAISVINASGLGLEPNLIGECYLVPFNKECTLMIGYKGIIKLARNSGMLISIQADVVHEGDVFEYEKGLDPKLRHIPSGEPEANRAITHFYAVAELKGGAKQFEVMTKAQVDAIRNGAPSKNSPAWVKHYPEMGKKTVVRRLGKYLPQSPEMARAIDLDERHEAKLPQTNEMIDLGQAEEIEATSTPSTADKVQSKLAAKKAAPEPAEAHSTMEETPFDAEFNSWPDEQQVKYHEARKAALGEGADFEDAHTVGYKAATSL